MEKMIACRQRKKNIETFILDKQYDRKISLLVLITQILILG